MTMFGYHRGQRSIFVWYAGNQWLSLLQLSRPRFCLSRAQDETHTLTEAHLWVVTPWSAHGLERERERASVEETVHFCKP